MEFLRACLIFGSINCHLAGEKVVSTLEREGEYGFRKLFPDVDSKDICEIASRLLAVCEAKGIEVVTFCDDAYPEKLKEPGYSPPVIYTMGNLGMVDSFAGAVVGSRKPSSLGLEFTERVVEDLVGVGIPIISGMAVGIDQAAHRAALAAGGKTVAVLGTGLDVTYPSGSEKLMEQIVREGCVISQFPPGTPPKKHHFPMRNRIIAALSDFVCVMEAAEKSGSLITARNALDFGREVFAVPGHPLYPRSAGCNILIKSGAHPLTSAGDVLEVFGFSVKAKKKSFRRMVKGNEVVEMLLAQLETPLNLEDLSMRTHTPPEVLLPTIIELEMEGVLKRLVDGRYVVA